jgi:P2-related tail formation protein
LTGLAISLETAGTVFIGASVYEGDELSVYPPTQRDIDVSGVFRTGGREHHIDTMDIYS